MGLGRIHIQIRRVARRRLAWPRRYGMRVRTIEKRVDLSGFHSGQIVEHIAFMRAEGHEYTTGRDAFRRPVVKWRADRWQAEHYINDRSGLGRTLHTSPWFSTRAEAETWLSTEEGLVLGGEYWSAK